MIRNESEYSAATIIPACALTGLRGVLDPRRSLFSSPRPVRLRQRHRRTAAEVERWTKAVEPDLIEWRRHLHQHPELSNREVETAKYVAERLRSFGLEPKTGIAKTGVVAVLTGGKPGPVVALRADMDGLPVREETNVPFASTATTEYEGNTVGVMHACGHDTHVAILLATAKVLTQMKDRIPGSVKFIFQPAEEGAPIDERPAGAELMVQQGVLQDPKVDAIFGLHSFANVPSGYLTYRSGPFMAAADQFDILVTGKQAHGSSPWRGVDPIVVGSQIVTALQTIVSRNVDITRLPAIVSVGQFQSGVRNNIIPETARLVGTIRTFDDAVREDIHARVRRIAEGIASGAGATVNVTIHKGNAGDHERSRADRAHAAVPRARRPRQGEGVGAHHRARRTSRTFSGRCRGCSSFSASRRRTRSARRRRTTRRCSTWTRARCRPASARSPTSRSTSSRNNAECRMPNAERQA